MNPEELPYEVGKFKPPGAKFSSTNQPSAAAKKAGRWKKLRGAELVRDVLHLVAQGKECEEIRRAASEYFKIPEKQVTFEIMLLYKQAEKALKEGDTRAYVALMDRAFGKPNQKFSLDFVPPEPTEFILPGGRRIII